MDDLGDFLQAGEDAGKDRGTDLLQRRPTLPIIYALEELPSGHVLNRIMLGERCGPEDLDVKSFENMLTI